MALDEFADLSFAELRSRLKARADNLESADLWNLAEVLDYLVALPERAHTVDSVGAFIQLARSFFYTGRMLDTLTAASHASRLAKGIRDQALLGRALDKQGAALISLGRLAEATIAHAEAWSIALELKDHRLELFSTWGMADICSTMGQWAEAIRYHQKVHQLAKQIQAADLEISARTYIAECAIQMRNPHLGLQVLSSVRTCTPATRTDAVIDAERLAALTELYLQVGDVVAAQDCAERAIGLAAISNDQIVIQKCRAAQGLVDVRSGRIQEGLATVRECLSHARLLSHSLIPGFLGVCMDAHETCGYPEQALSYLQELVDWKRGWIEAAITPCEHVDLPIPSVSSTVEPDFDLGLVAKSQLLQTSIQRRLQDFLETAINAEIVRGHGLYRTFRVSRLACLLAEAVGWSAERVYRLKLGAQLCSIGMLAVPASVLQKSSQLSESEWGVLRDHARYGSELLRRSNLQVLKTAVEITGQYRERYDGSGYPHGLRGSQITEEARVVAVCDAFDAVTHERVWRPDVMSIAEGIGELANCASTQFDPAFTAALIKLLQHELPWSDLDTFLGQEADEFEYVRARTRMEAVLST